MNVHALNALFVAHVLAESFLTSARPPLATDPLNLQIDAVEIVLVASAQAAVNGDKRPARVAVALLRGLAEVLRYPESEHAAMLEDGLAFCAHALAATDECLGDLYVTQAARVVTELREVSARRSIEKAY